MATTDDSSFQFIVVLLLVRFSYALCVCGAGATIIS